MTALQISTLTLLLVTLVLIAGFGQSAFVQQADEDRAVKLVFELIGNLSAPPDRPPPGQRPGMPPINNVCSGYYYIACY